MAHTFNASLVDYTRFSLSKYEYIEILKKRVNQLNECNYNIENRAKEVNNTLHAHAVFESKYKLIRCKIKRKYPNKEEKEDIIDIEDCKLPFPHRNPNAAD